jgi:hypothetical protein
VPGFRRYYTQTLASLNYQCHAFKSKSAEAGTVVLQVHKVLNAMEILAGCTAAEVGESSKWTSVVNSAEENRADFCKVWMGSFSLARFTACIRQH